MFYQIYNIHLLNGEVIQSSEDYDLPAKKGLVGACGVLRVGSQ